MKNSFKNSVHFVFFITLSLLSPFVIAADPAPLPAETQPTTTTTTTPTTVTTTVTTETAPATPAPDAAATTTTTTTTTTTPADPVAEYSAIYKSGTAPLREKSNVKLLLGNGALEVNSLKPGETPWRLLIPQMRGATAVQNGVWFYWYGDGNVLQQGYFDMPQAQADAFSGALNKMLNDFYQRPAESVEKLKNSYEAYRVRALEDSK